MADNKKPDVPKTVEDKTKKTGTDTIPDWIPRTCGGKPHDWVMLPGPTQVLNFCGKCDKYFYEDYED